jgi:hypothetical protein
VSISAHAKRRGLVELERFVADAATAALLESPGSADLEDLKRLAGIAAAGLLLN